MLRIKKYTKVQSLDEAYETLNKNRNNVILGGMMWLKMEERMINEAIDLSALNLNRIEEKEDEYQIGSMCSLRQLETHQDINHLCQNVIKDALCDIVGVQFRNMATVGGSIYSRFGFSDVLTVLMCLDCDVILHHQGRVPLEAFAASPYEKDIITHICIKKKNYHSAFECVRKSATDIAVLNLAMTKQKQQYKIVVGARPHRAESMYVDCHLLQEELILKVQEQMPCSYNMRGSQEYREKLIEALIIKALRKLED